MPGPTNAVSWTTPPRSGIPGCALSTKSRYAASSPSTRDNSAPGVAALPDATTRGVAPGRADSADSAAVRAAVEDVATRRLRVRPAPTDPVARSLGRQVLGREHGRLRAALHPQLRQQAGHVVLDCLLREEHPLADLPVREALTDQLEDAPLLI